jgi:type I restriction enzyme S subunit
VCCIGATIGKTDIAEVPCAFNQQINAVEWNEAVAGEYGTICLRELRAVIVGRGSSTALPILKKSLFEAIEIPVPPRSAQEIFATRALGIRGIAGTQRQCTAHAAQAFQSLLAGVFGEGP